MNLNATLFGQMITFAIFIWFTLKFVWPPIKKAIHDRQKTIADGLAAAEKGQRDLELAEIKFKETMDDAKTQAAALVDEAHHRANRIVEEAKDKARTEGERLLEMAQAEIEQAKNAAKAELVKEVSELALAGAEKILQKEVSA